MVMSSAYCAPPTACAASRMMPSCMTASHVGHASPGAADERVGVDVHVVEVDPVLRVGRDRHLLGERDAGARSGRRGTTSGRRRCARARAGGRPPARTCTWRLTPSSRQPSPSARRGQLHALGTEPAAGLQPRGRDDRLARADLRAATPPAARRSRRARARRRSSPSSRSAATAPARARARCRRRPRRASSCPLPPYSSGSVMPSRPSSASCSQNLSE